MPHDIFPMIESSDDENSVKEASENSAVIVKVELLKHLSKEVEHVSNQLIAQRSKNNLLVAFAPYLSLGILATNKDMVDRLQKISDESMYLFSAGFCLVYLILGLLAAKIEKNFWDQGNYWRGLIADVSGTSLVSRNALNFSSEKLILVYAIIYSTSAAGFVFCLNVFHQRL